MKTIAAVILSIVLSAACAAAGGVGDAVEVRIVTDEGRTLPTYPVKVRNGMRKVYAEAVKGDYYRIEVTNRLNRRVGLVIAVDGRNIISGGKSWLKNNERMYILEPYGSGQFAGWRSSQTRINRFYFTDVPDSYAAAFGDESAMGVIAVAAYPEVQRYEPPPAPLTQAVPSAPRSKGSAGKGAGSADSGRNALEGAMQSRSAEGVQKKGARQSTDMESAGTGYGHEEYSPSSMVAFSPEKRAIETIFLKYEWRETLCRLGVIRRSEPPRTPNRLWDNSGYAPPPPGRS